MNRPFTLDKDNARLMGVCAGLARSADMDPFLVRIAAVALTLYLFPITLILYLAAAWAAPDGTGEEA
jgi:phage shock protein C